MNAITTRTISKNFRLYDPTTDSWIDYTKLTEFVNFWKMIFVEKNHLSTGAKIGLGFVLTDIYYFSAILAATELGFRLVVLDISNNANVSTKSSQVQDFLPFDLFILGTDIDDTRIAYCRKNSLQTEPYQIWNDYVIQDHSKFDSVSNIMPNEDDVLLLCTSSGTTNRPKKVEHTHEFLYRLAVRNKDLFKFDGNVLHVRSLHHGSGLGVFFLPSLVSDECTGHYYFNFSTNDNVSELVDFCVKHDINHCQFPYTRSLESFLQTAVDKGVTFSNLTLYTFSYINPSWRPLLEKCNVSSIISIFGCNETSGPLFINKLTAQDTEFDNKKFFKLDDFYSYEFNDIGQLLVEMPVYNKTIVMQDSFTQIGNEIIHNGRNDLARINDIEIDLFWLLNLCAEKNMSAQIVIDREYEKLSLAVWDDSNPAELIKELNGYIVERYGPNVSITNGHNLNYSNYLIGIKLDHEQLRNFFRELNAQTSI